MNTKFDALKGLQYQQATAGKFLGAGEHHSPKFWRYTINLANQLLKLLQQQFLESLTNCFV